MNSAEHWVPVWELTEASVHRYDAGSVKLASESCHVCIPLECRYDAGSHPSCSDPT
jgi:hypothetical protein